MVNSPVSIQDKKAFMTWFLKHYQFRKRESVWILNYISHHEDILAQSHFVRSVDDCPRGLIISTRCAMERPHIPFRFHKQHVITFDPERTFHDIRLHRDQRLYIQLNFYQSQQCPLYARVLEENPYDQKYDPITKQQDQEQAKRLLDKLLYERQKTLLEQAIDQALDELNYEQFKKLTTELQQLKKQFNLT